MIVSLVAFNLIFALQNGLDLAFLWSGAPLPGDLTLAGYAHRGAYPLIATALLAGLFVLVTLRPGSATARRAVGAPAGDALDRAEPAARRLHHAAHVRLYREPIR